MTEPSKSYIVPVGHDVGPNVTVNGHRYIVPREPVTLLGHNVTRRTLIGAQVSKQVRKARSALSSLYRFGKIKIKFKVHLIKTLVLPHLFYPTVPLHLARRPQMRKLQQVQNLALRWAFNIKWYEYVNNRKLHTDYRPTFRPVNQELYWRAKSLWDKIENHDAGDAKQLEDILNLKITQDLNRKEIKQFPSSHFWANEPEPAPLYG